MKFWNVLSGTLLIAGTTIGAGMLGIPLMSGQAGFWPAVAVTASVWVFMFFTGLLFLEVTLWMHRGSNVLSMSKRFLGEKGRLLAGGTFVFLYYCLMVGYVAAGAPLLMELIGIGDQSISHYAIFSLLFMMIVAFGLKFIDRVNYILMAGLIISYVALLMTGSREVSLDRLAVVHWPKMALAGPILFAAFGYHNIIPSLTDHFKGNGKVMRWAIFWGTLIPLVVYILWQYLLIGAIPENVMKETLAKGQPATEALQFITGNPSVKLIGRLFSLFALVTSLLGVSFSVVDFLGDGLKMRRTGWHRFILCFLTFAPPFLLASLDPTIFVTAVGLAGGFGEAFLNGILPAWLVWRGRYKEKLVSEHRLFGGKITLSILLAIAFVVMGLELYILVSN